MRFSQRIGKTEIKNNLEKEGLSQALRNLLWSIFLEKVLGTKSTNYQRNQDGSVFSELTLFLKAIWRDFLEWPIDELKMHSNEVDYDGNIEEIRLWYFNSEWFLVLDFIEFSVQYDGNKYYNEFNEILKKKVSAYRFVGGVLVEVDSQEEILELENVFKKADKFNPVKEHIQRALELISDRKKPDYRNSIKESISSIESICKIISGKENVSLKDALAEVDKKYKIPSNLRSAFKSLYGYTSQEGGIRHALHDKTVQVGFDEARFMLVVCSAFVNYMSGKIPPE